MVTYQRNQPRNLPSGVGSGPGQREAGADDYGRRPENPLKGSPTARIFDPRSSLRSSLVRSPLRGSSLTPHFVRGLGCLGLPPIESTAFRPIGGPYASGFSAATTTPVDLDSSAASTQPRKSTTSSRMTTIRTKTYERYADSATRKSHPLKAMPDSGNLEPGESDHPNATLELDDGQVPS